MKHNKSLTKQKHIINIAVFALCLLICGVANLVTRDQAVSEKENRALAQLPEFNGDKLFSGEYFTEYENYYADQFFSRDFFAGIRNDVKALTGLPGANEVQLVTAGGFNAFEEQITIERPEEGEAPEPSAGSSGNSTGSAFSGSLTEPNADTPVSTGEAPVTPAVGAPADFSAGVSQPAAPDTALNPSAGSHTTTTDISAAPAAALTPSAKEPTGSPDTAQAAGDQGSKAQAGIADKAAPSPTGKPARDDNGKTIGKVLIYKDSAYALFPFSEDSANYYANTLNQFRREAGEGVTVYSLLAPTSMEFLREEKFQKLTDSQKDTIAYVNARLKDVVPVDAHTPLGEHSDEYVYFRTDHHWTALGAYYAYTGFARAAGLEPVALDRYETGTIEGYVGSMYETTGSSNLKRNPDTITVYKPFTKNEYNVYYSSAVKMKVIDMSHADKKIKYRVFLSGDRPLGIIKTEVANGKRILVIKDSYGNAMVPFLLPHYEEIYVIDPRQYEKNIFSLIQKNEIQEVLFLNYVPVLSYNGFVDLIVKVMKSEEK